ncbi:MAG TPA: SNF2-related protein [Ktedonobacteraceae bacterium]|nr:SNF2-related protein [Ktedonobacteraceae bacterium]
MAVAPRRKKQVALPEGIDQLALFTSLTPVAPVIPAVKRQRQPRRPKVDVQQFDIFSLISEAFAPELLDPGQPDLTEKSAPPPRIRRTTHVRTRQADQLTFDSLAEAPTKDVPAIPAGESLAGEAGKDSGEYERDAAGSDSKPQDVSFFSLGDDDRHVSEGGAGGARVYIAEPEPTPTEARDIRITPEHGINDGKRTGRGRDARREDDINERYRNYPMVRPRRKEAPLPEGSLFSTVPEKGETATHEIVSPSISAESASSPQAALLSPQEPGENATLTEPIEEAQPARIYLEEPEPEPLLSRDLRITPEHAIGAGGLHEKARGNIAAIRLLKELEGQDREATDEEKAVLVKYAGWGALAGVFEEGYNLRREWRDTHDELKGLLTDTEYRSARATTPNAHFTSPMVIEAIWKGMERLGVKKGAEVLEPSMGVGHFFGLQPERLQAAHRTGVELDSITARIAKKLYPDATVFHKGFEETSLPDDYFDAVIGNVPFGNYPVHDPATRHSLTRSIHDYFFAKSLEKTRSGGIMALVTSHYTMDKKDDVIRKHLADKADLIGAIRLPNTAFKDNAGTEVVTDVIFLRKRAVGEVSKGETWQQAQETRLESLDIPLNEYFVRHPKMMLGELALKGTMYRDKEMTLVGELTSERLEQAISALPENVFTPRGQDRAPPQQESVHITEPERFIGVKDGAYTEVAGNIMIRNGDTLQALSIGASSAARVRGLIEIRDAVREVFRTQLDDEPEEIITAARRELNRVYDRFTSRHSYITSKENFRAFTGDPDHPLLLSLENYNAETKTATKTAIFERRTLERYKPVEKVGTAAEALAVSLNERGSIDWQRMQQLTGSSMKQMQAELGGLVFETPAGQWETADEYLSGDVRRKLRQAEAAAAINPIYERNVGALKAVQPEDLKPGDISARLGAGWIPQQDIKAFICDLFKVKPDGVTIAHSSNIASWTVTLDYFAEGAVANTTTYGTKRTTAANLIEDALNLRTPTIYDYNSDNTKTVNQTETLAAREAQQKLKDRFSKWIWEDPARAERLAHLYNDRFNNIRLRTYDGSHLTFPGMNRVGLRNNDLDPHQKNAVWRTIQNKNTLLGHCVGAGKTAEITASVMEKKRLGLATKSMIVVPNHLVEQWGNEFLKLYPQANIFVAGKEHFTAGNREKAMARIATGNYDAVIISHKSFEALPVSNATFNRFLDQQIEALEEEIQRAAAEKGDNRSIVKQLEKSKKRLEARIKDRAGREKKDDGVTWEQLGVDNICVDEADLFKNLGYVSKMTRIAGLSNTESNRAMDMYMKTRYLAENGGGVTFATGTPISNTMAEMYTLMRYLAPEILRETGTEHFDAWAANYGEAVTSLELAPDGSGYRMNTRFAKFVNLPELLSQFRIFADIQTAEMLRLPRPELAGGKAQAVAAPASPELKDYVESLVIRAQKCRNGGDLRIDNMLKITGDGRKAALDMRLVRPDAEPNPDSKLNRAIDNVHRVWKETAVQRSTQLVFCDLSTPNPDKFNVYDEMKRNLIARGVPEKEIAYIHDADTDAKKKLLFDAVNAGRVRVLLGSTEKMGAGTNVQKKLIAMHHLDAPWRPRDIEQRDGRILRQGNENKQIQIYRYVTEGSFDAYMWQTLETKARFIQQVMTGDVTVREAEDLEGGALSFAEIKAIASGNPAVMEKVRIDTEVRKLDQLRAAHINQQYEITKAVRSLPEKIKQSQEYRAHLLEDIGTRTRHEKGDFAMAVSGRQFNGKDAKEDAGDALIEAVMAGKEEAEFRIIGNYRGFQIMTRGSRFDPDKPELYLRGKEMHRASFNPESAFGTLSAMDYALKRLDRLAEEEKSSIERREQELADYKEQQGKPFEHEDRLKELLIKQGEVNKQLDLDKGDNQVAANDNDNDEKAATSSDSDTNAQRLNMMDQMMQKMTEVMLRSNLDGGLHEIKTTNSASVPYHTIPSPRR